MKNFSQRGIRISSIILSAMALFSVNYLDLSGVLIAASIVITFMLYGKYVSLDKNALLLILFSCSYFLSIAFYEGISIESTIKYALAPWGCYLIGYTILRVEKKVTVEQVAFLIFMGFFIHGMLNFFSAIKIYGFDLASNYRQAYDFWQNRTISVTTAALYYSPMALYAFSALVQKNTKKRFAIVILILCIIATMMYQNRTFILALGGLLLIRLLHYMLDTSVKASKKLAIVISMIVMIMLSTLAWNLDVGSIKSSLTRTRLFERLTSEGQDRTDIWLSFIREAWRYPFGGNQAILYNNKGYVHNLWLDVYRRTGVLPFVSLVLFTIIAIRSGSSFLKRTDIKENRQTTVYSLLGIAMISAVEPIIEANPYFFYIAIIVIGAMNGRMWRNEVIQ